MNQADRLAIFSAQTQNVRKLETAIKIVRRSVHSAFRRGDEIQADVQTRVFAQIFCAWAEANFLKVIHTPHGFTLAEIVEVKRVWSESGLATGWEKAVQLGLRKVPGQRSGFVPNARQTIGRAIKKYVANPAVLRNKIAHGQWFVALNRGNASVNQALTTMLGSISIIDVDRWHGGHRGLSSIVETLIESPERTFARDYWPQLTALQEFELTSDAWTLPERKARLVQKYQWREK